MGKALLFFLLAACSTNDTSESNLPTTPGNESTQNGTPPSSTSSALCQNKRAQPVDSVWTISSSGLDRTSRVHVPSTYDPAQAMPVVLNFHGFTSNDWQEQMLGLMNKKADNEHFIAVHPKGLGTPASWNAGKCCGEFSVGEDANDVKFVSDLLDELEARLCVDTHRVFVTGMSNGGFFSHRLACELSTRIAAAAPVAGVLGIESCTPARPIPIMQFHGTLDPLVPYNGSGFPTHFPSVPDTLSDWAKRNGCSATPNETFRKNEAHCARYAPCTNDAVVELCTVDGGGHTWPGGVPIPVGYTTYALNATDRMWDFFTAHPLP